MPGETTHFKSPNGWYATDAPTLYFRTRDESRAAYKKRQYYATGGVKASLSATQSNLLNPHPLTGVVSPAPAGPTFTGLQARLYDRLTNVQGVLPADAEWVIDEFGYNQAASYGHIREAGATHMEAAVIVAFEIPSLSLAYGLARADGLDHGEAVVEAFKEVDASVFDSDD